MSFKTSFALLVILVWLSGCGKDSPEKKANACALLTGQEIEAAQGSAIKESKSSEQSDRGFRVSQCYFQAEETSQSVSLAVTQSDLDHPVKRTPKDYWREMFADHAPERVDVGEGRQNESESAGPEKIEGVGDDAYWIGNRVGGALYAIKGKTFIRLSLGGPNDQKTKIEKSKTLARKALDRL